MELESEFLVLRHPVTRFITGITPHRAALSPSLLTSIPQLRVLLIASNTGGLEAVDKEITELKTFFQRQKTIPVKVTALTTSQATFERVEAELRKPDYDIIHYAGHGNFVTGQPGQSPLYFWTEAGEKKEVSANTLKIWLEDSAARLVYLSSCYGSMTADTSALLDNDYLGLADALVYAGIPSVLGFRWAVHDDEARRLALAFYRSLFEHADVSLALLQARRDLAAFDRSDPAWLSPILIHQV